MCGSLIILWSSQVDLGNASYEGPLRMFSRSSSAGLCIWQGCVVRSRAAGSDVYHAMSRRICEQWINLCILEGARRLQRYKKERPSAHAQVDGSHFASDLKTLHRVSQNLFKLSE